MEQITAQLRTIGVEYGLQLVGAVAILILGWIIAKWFSRVVTKRLHKMEQVDPIVAIFVGRLVRWAIIIVTVFAVLDQFGIETAGLLAVIASAGLAIGLALQGALGNLAAGLMLLIFRPFKIGDFVQIGGESGSVAALGLLNTEIDTPQNVRIVVPNGKVWSDAINNYSKHDTRRLDLMMGIDYGDSIELAIQTSKAIVEADDRAHKDPAPKYVVKELADSSVNIEHRIWCDNGDYWGLFFDLQKGLKEAYDKAGLSIPFPQQDVHMYQKDAA